MSNASQSESNQLSLQALVELVSRKLQCFGDTARQEASWLILACLDLKRATLITNPELALNAAQITRVLAWSERRARGEPLAYLSGTREFWSLALNVDACVLVPRPETERLVELALEHGDTLHVLDLGTGSGAVALALAHERPQWSITAIDRSIGALAIAQANAAKLGLAQVEFLLGDWFTPVTNRRFDLIVANPPYVAADDPAMQSDSLRFEPREALTPGLDALADLRHIAMQAPMHLLPSGCLLLEHGTTQGAAVRALLVAQGFTRVVSYNDYAGHERVTVGHRPQ